jgi:myo-inositol-1-phosphate synthase
MRGDLPFSRPFVRVTYRVSISQDSLLATPLILDLTILTELLTRVQYRRVGSNEEFQPLYSVLSLLSYMLKAPLVKPGTECVIFLVIRIREIRN